MITIILFNFQDSTKGALGAYIPPGPPPAIIEPYIPMSTGIPFPPPVINVPPPNFGGGLKRGHDGGSIAGEPPHKR